MPWLLKQKLSLYCPFYSPPQPGSPSHYLTFQYVPEPQTMFAGVYKIPPAGSFWQQGVCQLGVTGGLFSPAEKAPWELKEQAGSILRGPVRLHTGAAVQGALLSRDRFHHYCCFARELGYVNFQRWLRNRTTVVQAAERPATWKRTTRVYNNPGE